MRWVWLALFLLIVTAFVFLPNFLSSEWGKGHLLYWVNNRIEGKIEVHELDLSWYGPQRARQIALFSPKGEEIAQVEEVESYTSLFSLLLGRQRYGETLAVHPKLKLERDQKGETNLQRSLSSKGKGGWPLLTGKFTVTGGEVQLVAPKIEPIAISDLNLEYFPSKHLFHLTARTQEGEIAGMIFASGSLGEGGHVLAQIENFPVAILDQLQNTHLYTEALGERLNIAVESTKKGGEITLDATVESRLLKGKIEGRVEESRFLFDPKSALTLEITPSLFRTLMSSEEGGEWRLASPSQLVFDIQKGEIPLSLDWKQSRIKASAAIARMELHHEQLGHYAINGLQGTFTAQEGVETIAMTGEIVGKERATFSAKVALDKKVVFSWHSDGFPYSLLELAFEESRVLERFFGETIKIDVEGVYSEKKGLTSSVAIESFTTQVKGKVEGEKLKNLTFALSGSKRLTGNWKEMLGESTDFTFTGDAAFVNQALSISRFQGEVRNSIIESEVKGQLGKKGAPFSFSLVKVEGKGKLLHLPPNKEFAQAQLKSGLFSFELDGKRNRFKGETLTTFSVTNGDERVDSKEVKATLKVEDFIHDNHLDMKKASVNFSGNLEHFPTAFFSSWLPDHVSLSALIGATVNLQINSQYAPGNLVLDFDAHSPGFSAQLGIDVGANFHVAQNKPGHLHWEMSPGRYRALLSLISKEEVAYELRSAPALDISIERIQCPKEYPNSVKSFLCRSGVSGKIEVGKMLFVDPQTQERFAIENIRGGILGENFSRKMHLDLDGDVLSSHPIHGEEPHFALDLDILNAWNDGEAQLALTGELNLAHLPVRQLLGILPLNPVLRTKSEAVLGETMNGHLTAQIAEMEGPISLEIWASNFKGMFPLQLVKDHLELRETLQAEITLTDAVSQNFLIDINPMLIQGARSDHPMRLFIAPEGFSFPIPWSFKELNIEHAVVDVGKIYVHNGGAIQELMEFLKSQPPKGKMMRAWFTPVFLSLKEGVLRHERFDMLLHKKVHIALWGRVDLVKGKVWMTLGIAPSTLKQRFNVLGLTKKDMFQVKMRGFTNAVELDWSSAYTRIGILIARLAGGPPGYLVGGLLEQVISALGEEPTPPPTTYPFPWDEKKGKKEEAIPEINSPPSNNVEKGRKKLLEFIIP